MISIVTISMNQGEFLPTAVNSVLAQRDVDLEYIIVDPGSTDGSREYLKGIRDSRVRLILEPDNGPADGLNTGVQSTTGGVIGYLNADDLYLAGALRGVEQCFRRLPGCDVVYGDGWIIDIEDRIVRHIESTPWGLRRFVHGGVNVLQQSTFFRREAFDRTSGFNPANKTCWDGELLVDLALAGARLHHVRADWGAFRLHSESISGSRRLERQYQEDLRRISSRALGRSPGPGYGVWRSAFRGFKLLRSPGYTIRRLGSRPSSSSSVKLGADGYIPSDDVTGL